MGERIDADLCMYLRNMALVAKQTDRFLDEMVCKRAAELLEAREQQPPPALPSLQEIEEHLRAEWTGRLDRAAADVIAVVRNHWLELEPQGQSDLKRIVHLEAP